MIQEKSHDDEWADYEEHVRKDNQPKSQLVKRDAGLDPKKDGDN